MIFTAPSESYGLFLMAEYRQIAGTLLLSGGIFGLAAGSFGAHWRALALSEVREAPGTEFDPTSSTIRRRARDSARALVASGPGVRVEGGLFVRRRRRNRRARRPRSRKTGIDASPIYGGQAHRARFGAGRSSCPEAGTSPCARRRRGLRPPRRGPSGRWSRRLDSRPRDHDARFDHHRKDRRGRRAWSRRRAIARERNARASISVTEAE